MTGQNVFYHRLKEQIKVKGRTFNQVERDLNYPRNALNNYKQGIEPSGLRLVELSEYFGVSPRYLIGKREEEEEDDSEILERSFQSLNFEQKRELHSICQSWATSQLSKKDR